MPDRGDRFISDCCEKISVTNIKFEENNKKIIFNNKDKRDCLKVRVDGCQIKEGTRCDYLLIDLTNSNEYFVELKGTDISHAIEQLKTSLAKLSDTNNKNKKVQSFIVAANVAPQIRTNIQKAQKNFKKAYYSSLKIVENSHTVAIDN